MFKGKYRPDLPPYDVPTTTAKRKYSNVTASSEEIGSYEKRPKKCHNIKIPLLNGMENSDAVSCYCNACMQCLLRAKDVIEVIGNSPKINNL